jgi:hypothetical protein
MLDKAALLATMPESASTLLTEERMIGVRDHADTDKAREAALDLARARWRLNVHTCVADTETSLACDHLMGYWRARGTYELAALGAPEDASGCDCSGTGIYHGHGYVENGVFKGTVGECFRCQGKGYQTPADVKRNAYYDNHVRRIRL